MTETNIPAMPVFIPAGPGSQPTEADGTELDILQLPNGMDTYAQPMLPEPEEVEDLTAAKALLRELLDSMLGYRVDMPTLKFEVDQLDAANRDLVDQVLGEGEVSIVFNGGQNARVQESVLAGVWRVKYLDGQGKSVNDRIEVAAIPELVSEATFMHAAEEVSPEVGDIPEGVVNALPLLAEINDKIGAYRPGGDPHVLNLTLLPQSEQDLAFLEQRLGAGTSTILSRGYGNCRITSTATRNLWWVRYFNSQDRNILNSLEITRVPNVACAAQEDIDDSADRLAEILEIYQ